MAYSALNDVYPLLPKTNCGKCPYKTCIAFAVNFLKRGLGRAMIAGEAITRRWNAMFAKKIVRSER